MKFSHVLGGSQIPDNIKATLDEQPARSGMYNWIFVHKGEINNFETIKDNLEDYDQIQVNMSPKDMCFIPEIRRRLKNSSTKLILNNDYVCEYWGNWKLFDPYRYDNIQRMGDMVFSTEPNQVSNMIDGTFVIPHPTNTEVLKRLGTQWKDESSIGFVNHWWAEWNTYVPNRIIKKAKETLGIKRAKIYGHTTDDTMNMFAGMMWDEIVPLGLSFPQYFQRLQGEKIVYDPNPFHTYGRNGVELACSGTPVVGSNRVFSYNKLFPELTCDPYNCKETLKLFDFIMKGNEKLQQVLDRAKQEVDYFSYKTSKERWNQACDLAFDRGGHKWMEKQI